MSIQFDYQRLDRIGIPEAIFCQGKDFKILNESLLKLSKEKKSFLLTRLSKEVFKKLNKSIQKKMDYHELSLTAYLNGPMLKPKKGKKKSDVVIITGGTADSKVAWESKRVLEFMGVQVKFILDAGVAGIWRLQKRLSEIESAQVVIACAGMEASLPTVLAGLIPQPIISVPVSHGYGVSTGGHTALMSMLASCSPGLMVVNIDNGYGAACGALRILNIGNSKNGK